jgi:hypothetical protein
MGVQFNPISTRRIFYSSGLSPGTCGGGAIGIAGIFCRIWYSHDRPCFDSGVHLLERTVVNS